jgi:hypothetical protein
VTAATKAVLYNNRWTTKVLIIGGTAVIVTVVVAVCGIGDTKNGQKKLLERRKKTWIPFTTGRSFSRAYPRSASCLNSKDGQDKNLTETPTTMFSITSYVVEKIGSLIAWCSSSSVIPSATLNGRTIERGEAVELDEQHRSLVAVEEELSNMKRLLEEARVREGENLKKIEELEAVRKEVEGLRGERKGREDEKENVGIQGEEDTSIAIISESEVVDLVKSLNQEILHLSEIIVKAFESVARPSKRSEGEETPEELKEAFACVEEILGERMVGLLAKVDDEDDGEVVRTALKASMSAYTHWIISSWYFENPEDENLLSEIYARVREAGEFVIFAFVCFSLKIID